METAGHNLFDGILNGDHDRLNKPLQRSVFKWVRACDEAHGQDSAANYKLHATITATEVAQNYGVQQKDLMKYLDDEIREEKSCQSLPFTLAMVTIYALVVFNHNQIQPIYAVEDSIMHAIEDDAEFAFSNDYHGHKSMYDVDNFQEYWSWLIDGFIPLFFDQEGDYSEQFPETAMPLNGPPATPRSQRGFTLNYNRIIGGIRIRQESSSDEVCESSPDLWEFYNKSCVGGKGYELWPETWSSFGIANPTSEWWLYIQDDVEDVLQDAIDQETSSWLSDRTTKVELAIPVYNAGLRVYSLVTVNFFFNRGGMIWKRVLAMSTFSNWFLSGEWMWANVVFDSLWCLGLSWLVVTELVEIVTTVKKDGGSGICTYIGFWNLVDWVSIVVGITIVMFFVIRNSGSNALNEELGNLSDINEVTHQEEYRVQVRHLASALEEEVRSTDTFRLLLAVYPVVNLVRLFKAFASQPRLSLFTRTLSAARGDLLHFLVVFISIFLTYAVSGVLLFGRKLEEFATFGHAIATCFRFMMGDFQWEVLSYTGRIEAGFWFMSFMIFIVMLMLNMLLAIVMDAYSDQKGKSTDSETLWEEGWEELMRWNAQRKGQHVRLETVLKCLKNPPLHANLTIVRTVNDGSQNEDEEGPSRKSRFYQRQKHKTFSSPDRRTKTELESFYQLVTLPYLLEVCPQLTKDQAGDLISKAVYDYWATNKTACDIDEMLMDAREVNFSTKKLKSKMLDIAESHTVDTRDFEPLVTTNKEFVEVRFADELRSCGKILKNAREWLRQDDEKETEMASAKTRRYGIRQCTQVDDVLGYQYVWISDDVTDIMKASASCGLPTRNDQMRRASAGLLCRVLAVEENDNIVHCRVPGVGDVWMPVTALGTGATENTLLASEKHELYLDDDALRLGNLRRRGEDMWLGVAAKDVNMQNSSEVDKRIRNLVSELSQGRETIDEALLTMEHLQDVLRNEEEETVRIRSTLLKLKRNVKSMTAENQKMAEELAKFATTSSKGSREREATKAEYEELVKSMSEENTRLKDALADWSSD